MMKEYFKRITTLPTKAELIFWWILRALMIYAFIAGFFKKPFDITDPLQVGANFLCMFVWEVFMMLPEKNALRHVSPRVQTFLIIGIFCASFGGKFLNLYYDFRWWDVILHFVGGGACVFFGYEMVAAMQKRDKVAIPLSIALLCAMGFSFLAGTGWELFEFSFDQISCISTKAAGNAIAMAGDAQHWNLAAALGTPKEATLINPVFAERWPIMDTMADIVLNTLGALAAIIFLRIFPYRHKGKYNLNELYKDNKVVKE
jgi:hypothetical protein